MERGVGAFFGMFLGTLVAFMFYWLFVGWAHYSIWSNDMEGRAKYARANQDREIKVREATAMADAAVQYARAEIERAKGVAEANKIISGSLEGADGYLKYLYIQQLGNADKNERTIVYVPTDGLIPLTESGRALKK